MLDWPSMSPDMSPIKHVWDYLKRRVYARQAVVQEWNNI